MVMTKKQANCRFNVLKSKVEWDKSKFVTDHYIFKIQEKMPQILNA